MKKILLLLICFSAMYVSAQYYANPNKIWVSGSGVGLDFTSGAPVPFATSIASYEASASVCNSAGHLLFYTDGYTVYNKLGTVMPGGAAIVPYSTTSSTQGALIVPFLNDTNKYYIFSLEEYGGSGRVAYSVVDMTLAGGLGDLASGSTGIIFNSGMSEKMIAVTGDSCNIWVLLHKKDTAQFYAFSVTSTGVLPTPVISSVGALTGLNCYAIGVMKGSHDRQKIATVTYGWTSSTWGVELYHFDPATGLVSNCQLLDFNPAPTSNYGAEFSPDNSKLYSTNDSVLQWDISLPTTAAIAASKTTIFNGGANGDMRLAPNGKIYVIHYGGFFIDCITSPNVAGAGCGYVPSAVNIYPATSGWDFPNRVPRIPGSIVPTPTSTTLCLGTTTTLSGYTSGGVWGSSNPSVATVNSWGVVTAVAPGTSLISYSTGSSCDGSVMVTVVAGPTLTSAAVCAGGSTTLTASTGAGTWTSGSSGIASVGSATGVVTGVSSGTAVITYNRAGCPQTTTIVTVNVMSITGGSMCIGSSITMSGTTPGGTWSSSATSVAPILSWSGVATGITAGTTTISYSAGGCLATTIVTVTASPSLTGGSVCTGSTLTLSSSVTGGTWSTASSLVTVGASSGTVTGLVAGTAEITYTTGACINTTVVTVNLSTPPMGAVLCAGSTATLSGTIPGGTWSSGNPLVATVGLSTGVVSAIAAGTATISYNNGLSCPEITNVTVNPPPGPIAGKLSICVGFTTGLSCSPAGGSWSSSSTNATISSTGMVTGVSAGTTTITYMLPGGCFSVTTMTIDPLPAPIAGSTTVVLGSTATLSDATAGGSWTSGDVTKATVTGSGVVSGVALGTAIVYYSLPTGCKASVVINVVKKGYLSVASGAVTKPMLYPNPAANEITIQAEPSAYTTFIIYTSLGQEVIRHEITSTETKVSVKTLAPGEYRAVFAGEGVSEVVQLVKW